MRPFKQSKDRTTPILIGGFVALALVAIVLGFRSLDLVESNAKVAQQPVILQDQKLLDPLPIDTLKPISETSNALNAQDFMEERGAWGKGTGMEGQQLIRQVSQLSDKKMWPEVITKATKAIDVLQAEDKRNPGRATKFFIGWAYAYRARAFAYTHQMEKALADANMSIKIRPTERADAYIVRAEVYELMGRHDLAKPDMKKAASLRHAHDNDF